VRQVLLRNRTCPADQAGWQVCGCGVWIPERWGCSVPARLQRSGQPAVRLHGFWGRAPHHRQALKEGKSRGIAWGALCLRAMRPKGASLILMLLVGWPWIKARKHSCPGAQCLEVTGHPDNDVPLQQWTCINASAQRFKALRPSEWLSAPCQNLRGQLCQLWPVGPALASNEHM
jgi:hypothetical protein